MESDYYLNSMKTRYIYVNIDGRILISSWLIIRHRQTLSKKGLNVPYESVISALLTGRVFSFFLLCFLVGTGILWNAQDISPASLRVNAWNANVL